MLAALAVAAACAGAADPAAQAPHPSGLVPIRLGEVVLGGAGGGPGGLSGLWIAPDGARLVAIGDTGTLARGRPVFDQDGVLTDVADLDVGPLPGIDGRVKADADAEAIAAAPDGSWLVSFERRHRILRFDGDGDRPAGQARPIPLPAEAVALPANSGIEALAVLADGTIVACAEAASGDGNLCWIGGEGGWRPTRYKSSSGLPPVDMEVLPSGDLLVLERGFSLTRWFSSRLTLVDAASLRGDGPLVARDLGAVQPAGGSENLEGLADYRDRQGRIMALLLSDDNFSPLQRTILVQYWLRPAGADDPSAPSGHASEPAPAHGSALPPVDDGALRAQQPGTPSRS